MVLLKYLSNFWRTLQEALSNCESNLLLTWCEICISFDANGNQATTFTITDTKLYVLVVTLLTQDNAKILQQLKSGFKRINNWNKYQSKITTQLVNKYLDYLIDPSFRGLNMIFLLSFENNSKYKIFSSNH